MHRARPRTAASLTARPSRQPASSSYPARVPSIRPRARSSARPSRSRRRQVLKNVDAILRAAGSSMAKVVSASFILRYSNDFAGMNEEWLNWFRDRPTGAPGRQAPARDRRPAHLHRGHRRGLSHDRRVALAPLRTLRLEMASERFDRRPPPADARRCAEHDSTVCAELGQPHPRRHRRPARSDLAGLRGAHRALHSGRRSSKRGSRASRRSGRSTSIRPFGG